jgi:hypothetical protein
LCVPGRKTTVANCAMHLQEDASAGCASGLKPSLRIEEDTFVRPFKIGVCTCSPRCRQAGRGNTRQCHDITLVMDLRSGQVAHQKEGIDLDIRPARPGECGASLACKPRRHLCVMSLGVRLANAPPRGRLCWMRLGLKASTSNRRGHRGAALLKKYIHMYIYINIIVHLEEDAVVRCFRAGLNLNVHFEEDAFVRCPWA